MNPAPSSDSPSPSRSFWRKLGGGSLSISLIVHAVILAAGVIWVVKVLPKPEATPEFTTGKAGGSSPGVTASQKRAARLPVSRVTAAGLVSTVTLPQVDRTPTLDGPATSLGGIVGGGGLGGNTFGAGGKDGWGTGNNGIGVDLKPPGIGIFGSPDAKESALTGTFYDTKQSPARKDTGMSVGELKKVIRDFTNGGWNERSLEKDYFKAPQTLYQTRIYMPVMAAAAAPAAFKCEKDVQPSRWIVLYKGTVKAPKSGKFRFVGAGDDVLVVRFNRKNVFDHGFTQGTTAVDVYGHVDVLAGRKEDRGVEKILRDGPMKRPVTFYQYDTTRNWNGSIGGLAVGAEFDVMAGRDYPVEILISEIPGGLFGAALMIQETGVDYTKASSGAPVLPLFRIDAGLPGSTSADNAPPYDAGGPVWPLSATSKPGI